MPPLQRGPCRVVVLVDTGKSMTPRWYELAHQFIPTLLDSLPNAKEDGTDVSVSIVPIRDGVEQTPPIMRFQDKRTQIQNLYNASFGAEVSEDAIWRGFERSTKLLCQLGDTSMKYLIVALTSFPGTGANIEAGPSDFSRAPWVNFANNIIKFDIRMTVIMEPVRSYKPVNDFFKYVLSQQKRQFTSPWFAYNARLHHFLISGFSKRSIIRERSKGGSTGTTTSNIPSASSTQSPVGKDNHRPGSLVELLRQRTGFWPAGTDTSASGAECTSSKSRSSTSSVRGTSQQKKVRSKERDEERVTPESLEHIPSPAPLQAFSAFMPTSNLSSPISENTYDWASRATGEVSPISPISPISIPTSHAMNMSSHLASVNMQQTPFTMYQPQPQPQLQSTQYNQPTTYGSTYTPHAQQSTMQNAGVYYSSTPLPQQTASRTSYRPQSPRTFQPIQAPGQTNYRQMQIAEPGYQTMDGAYKWQVPPQYLSNHSTLDGWNGNK